MSPALRSSAADLSHEREVLEELLRSEGWQVFVARCESEWGGVGFFARVGMALGTNDPTAVKVVHSTALEVGRALAWPKQRVLHLKGHVE